jgi:hypothetical protein
MGVWKNLVDEVTKARIAGQQPRRTSQPRNLTEADRIGWADAQDSRESSMKPRTTQDVRALVRNRNPIKWAQLQGNYRWLQKEMKKMGLNPEDARYIL